MDELDPHHDVVIEKRPWILAIEADSSHFGCQMDNDIWPCLFVQPPDIDQVDQIVIRKVGDADIFMTPVPEGLDEVFAKKAFTTGNGNTFIFHGSLTACDGFP